MQAKNNAKLGVGSRVNLDGRWHIVADREDDEWVLLSIEHHPQEIRCREFGVEVFAASSRYHGHTPTPIKVNRMSDPMDTVFIVFLEYIGNRQKPVIDWGYLIWATHPTETEGVKLLISHRGTDNYIESSEDRPVKKVFTFDELRLKNERLEQFWKSQQNALKCSQ